MIFLRTLDRQLNSTITGKIKCDVGISSIIFSCFLERKHLKYCKNNALFYKFTASFLFCYFHQMILPYVLRHFFSSLLHNCQGF